MRDSDVCQPLLQRLAQIELKAEAYYLNVCCSGSVVQMLLCMDALEQLQTKRNLPEQFVTLHFPV